MAAGFKIRKLTPTTSIGLRLQRARARQALTVGQLEESTKIRAKFIEALESDRWDSIPSEVYGRGYLERYAKALGLPVVTIMDQYDREKSKYAFRCQDAVVEFTPRLHHFSNAVLTPRLIGGLAAIVTVLGFGTAAGAQLMKFGQAPFLHVSTPLNTVVSSEHMLVATADHLQIEGKTLAGAVVSVNGAPTTLAGDGAFHQNVLLRKGVNAITVQATDSHGKTSSETLSVVSQ